jgi:hypothetical protein
MKKIALSLILPFLLNAADIPQSELVSFTAQKYKVDYNAQTQENKDKLKQEYANSVKLLNAISNEVKDDADYKVAKNLLAVNIWSQKYVQNLKISDATLKELYTKVKLNSQDFISSKKEGNIGWIEIQKLDKNIQENIKNKIKNDILISEVQNVGFQIILIDDFKPIRDVSFDESKEFLTNLAKQQELIKKVDSLLVK